MASFRQPVALDVPAGEALIDSGPERALSSYGFAFAVTEEAVYLPGRKKGFVLWDPFETIRVPLSAIRGVTLSPARASTAQIVMWILLVLLFAFVAIGYVVKDNEWKVGHILLTVLYLYSLIATILGPRGRYRVRVNCGERPLDFAPKLDVMISAKAKDAELEVQSRFLAACRRAGLLVVDARAVPIEGQA